MRLLITGAYGFVGSHVAREARRRGLDVIYGGDVLAPITHDFDVAIHCAGKFNGESDMARVNIEGTGNLVACGKPVVFFSSGAVYGPKNCAARETDEILPVGDYAIQKAAAEQLVDGHILRLYFPVGKGQKRGLLPKLMQAESVTIRDDAGPLLSLTDVRDAARVAVDCALGLLPKGTYNVCSPQVFSMRELARLLGKPTEARHGDKWCKDTCDWLGDSMKLRWAYAQQFRDPRQAIRRFITGYWQEADAECRRVHGYTMEPGY